MHYGVETVFFMRRLMLVGWNLWVANANRLKVLVALQRIKMRPGSRGKQGGQHQIPLMGQAVHQAFKDMRWVNS